MKKLIALLLALVMVLSLAACGAKEPEATEAPKVDTSVDTPATPDATEAPQEEVDPLTGWIFEEDTSISGTVRFWIPFKGTQGMDAMIAEFNESYPNITVELNTYSNNTDGNIALNTSIMAGECDVVASFEIHNLMTRLENGLYVDITDKVKAENIDLIANWGTDAYNYNDKVYTLPSGGLSHYVAINMDAWNAAGLGELPTEWTWDEYIEASRKMTEYNEDGTVAVYGGSNTHTQSDILDFLYQVNGCNRYYTADGNSAFDSDLVKSQLTKYLAAEEEGIWYKLSTYRSDNNKHWYAFCDKAVNSTIALNIPRHIVADEDYDFITGFAPYPVVEKGQTNYHSGVNYFSFAGITQGCQDEDAAWAFLKWYSTYGSKYLVVAGHQSTWIGNDSSNAVSLIFGSEEEAAKKIDVESFKRVVGNTENPNAYDSMSWAYSKLTDIWTEYVTYIFTGEMTLEEGLAEAAKLANEAIADAK